MLSTTGRLQDLFQVEDILAAQLRPLLPQSTINNGWAQVTYGPDQMSSPQAYQPPETSQGIYPYSTANPPDASTYVTPYVYPSSPYDSYDYGYAYPSYVYPYSYYGYGYPWGYGGIFIGGGFGRGFGHRGFGHGPGGFHPGGGFGGGAHFGGGIGAAHAFGGGGHGR
jgi:hypothetical protein